MYVQFSLNLIILTPLNSTFQNWLEVYAIAVQKVAYCSIKEKYNIRKACGYKRFIC